MSSDSCEESKKVQFLWAFAVAGAIESIHAIKRRELVSCSQQHLLDCVYPWPEYERGYMNEAFEWVIKNGGIHREHDYPYIDRKQPCGTNKEGEKITIDGYHYVPPYENALLLAVARQPIIAGVFANLDFDNYNGGIFESYFPREAIELNHAVLIVGYGSSQGEDYWILKNSWGTQWGEDGYMRLKRNPRFRHGPIGINMNAIYPVIKT